MSPVVMASHIRSASADPSTFGLESGGSVDRGGSKWGMVMRGESQRAAEEGSSKREMRLSSLWRSSVSYDGREAACWENARRLCVS
jgi:hypothetical protein